MMNQLYTTIYTSLVHFAQTSLDVDLPNQVNPSNSSFISTQVQDVITVVLGVMGAIAVLIITIAAFQYVVSAGDPQKTAKAKDTILYAFVGLLVAIMAIAILKFGLAGIFG